MLICILLLLGLKYSTELTSVGKLGFRDLGLGFNLAKNKTSLTVFE